MSAFDELTAAVLRLEAAREQKALAAQAYGVANADEVVASEAYWQRLTTAGRDPQDAVDVWRFCAWIQARYAAKAQP